MPRMTQVTYEQNLELARQRGFTQGREYERKAIAEEMKKLKEDARLKILNGIGQCFQANAQATEALARFVDNYNMNGS